MRSWHGKPEGPDGLSVTVWRSINLARRFTIQDPIAKQGRPRNEAFTIVSVALPVWLS